MHACPCYLFHSSDTQGRFPSEYNLCIIVQASQNSSKQKVLQKYKRLRRKYEMTQGIITNQVGDTCLPEHFQTDNWCIISSGDYFSPHEVLRGKEVCWQQIYNTRNPPARCWKKKKSDEQRWMNPFFFHQCLDFSLY